MRSSKKKHPANRDTKSGKPKAKIITGASEPGKQNEESNQLSSLAGAIAEKIVVEGTNIDLFSTVKPALMENELHTVVEELAEDMVDVFKKLGEISDRIISTENSITKLQSVVEHFSNSINRELDQIKDKLLSDRKEITSRATFNALMPAIESLQDMKRRYEPDSEEFLQQNTNSIIGILNGILQSLHYSSFEAKEGDLFDPNTMECYGYAAGDEGKVVRIERPGYKSGSVLVRPCAVILGKPGETKNN